MFEVDARGYSCPEPLLMATAALKEHPGEPIRVLVSTTNARDNVENAASKAGRSVKITQIGYDFELVLE